METSNADDNRKAIVVVIALMVALIMGVALGSIGQAERAQPEPVVETQEVTPQSCLDVIELDNQIIGKTADALDDIFDVAPMNELTEFVGANIDRRTELIMDCMATA